MPRTTTHCGERPAQAQPSALALAGKGERNGPCSVCPQRATCREPCDDLEQLIAPTRSSTRELLSPLAVEFRGATQWDPVDAEECAQWNEREALYAAPLRKMIWKLKRKENDMLKNLEGCPTERTSKRKAPRSPSAAGGTEAVIAKASELVAKMASAPCAESGCGRAARAGRSPNAKLSGYCDVHRHLRAFALEAGIEPDRAKAAKLLREKCCSIEVDITPALALALLEWNLSNRRINAYRIEMYARDMLSGDWRLNNQGIGIGANKLLVDGQHRLWAVVKSRRTVRMLVVAGLSPDACPTIDQGRARSVGDALQIFDGQPDGKRIVSWLKAIETLHGSRNTPISHAVARRQFGRFEESIGWCSSITPRAPYGRAPVLGAFVYAHAVDPARVEAFARRYVSGANLDEASPVLALRNYVADRVTGRVDAPRVISLKTLKCLLADQRGEPLTRVVASEDAFDHYHQLHLDAASPEEGDRMQVRRATESTSRAGNRS